MRIVLSSIFGNMRIYPMSALEPAPTVTTLPDDILHYRDPRILTVREYARLPIIPRLVCLQGKVARDWWRSKNGRNATRYTRSETRYRRPRSLAIARALQHVVSKGTGRQTNMGRAADAPTVPGARCRVVPRFGITQEKRGSTCAAKLTSHLRWTLDRLGLM
jgi:hypothetical protein